MTAIVNVELSTPLTPIETPAPRCMLIFRLHRRVVGRVVLRVEGGRIAAAAIQDAMRAALGREAADEWLDQQLNHDERRLLGSDALPAATIAICTRERPDDLARALAAVTAQRHQPLEVLVIDNAPSTEATRHTVERSSGVRYVREDRRGLDAARNRALREARGEVVAFTDDDAAPEPEWLASLLANFADRRVVVATGLTLPMELETEAQELFEQHCTFVRGFRRRVFDGQRDNPLAVGPVGAGANMALRRERVLAMGGFDERLDGGMPTRSGGDHDLFARVLMDGHRIVYDPAAVSWHRHRRTKEELLDTVYGYGVGVYAMWTGFVLERREIGVARLAWQWFGQSQVKGLLRPADAFARTIAWQELRGCVRGPQNWFAARRLRPHEP